MLTPRQEQIICELSPEHALICTGTAAELEELSDLGIVDLRFGLHMAGLTPVGIVVYEYVVLDRRTAFRQSELRATVKGLRRAAELARDRLDDHMGDTDPDDPEDPDLLAMQALSRALDDPRLPEPA